MFVSDSNIFNPSNIRLRICSMDGADIILEINPETTVDQLKVLAAGHFFDPSESTKTSLYHRLLHVTSGKTLEEEKTLLHEGLKDNDELLLLRKRTPPPSSFESHQNKRDERAAPSLSDINKATEGIQKLHMDREPKEALSNIDFQAELRKILISLIDAAQKILCLNPEASIIFKDAQKYMEEQSDDKPKIDPDALKQIMDMGFPELRAKKALIINKMSANDSIQWLVEHDSDADIDEPLPEMTSGGDSQPEEAGAVGGVAKTPPSPIDAQDFSKLAGPKKVASMLETFKAFRRKEFRPKPGAVKNLVEMGFDEKDVIDALRINGNKEEDACEWLLGGQKKVPDDDFDQGLDSEGPVYKAIMANPVVQLGLNNPRSLLAFLHMLENPGNTQQWLNDPDTGPMLIQISRIYHSEKHTPTS